MSNPQHGYFLIADITGYTMYLSRSELEHAQAILTALLELLIKHTRPPLIISRLAGDAVISYGLQDNFFQGQTFVEMIENTYVAFRKAIERMVLNNTCQCNACANVSSLDLKFFVHYGQFGIQRLSAHDELVGSDVNLLHRLLKNHVTEQTGVRAYTLYTDAAIRQLGIEGIRETMTPHVEAYEHLGEVQVWIQDMHPIWKAKKDTTRITIPRERIDLKVQTEIAMPPELVWDYLTQPEHRKVLIGSERQSILNRTNGRVAPGSIYQCYHGNMIIPQTIVEWRPFEQMTTQDLVPIPIPNTTVLIDYLLRPTEAGTRLIQAVSKPSGPALGRLLLWLFTRIMGKSYQRDIDAFRDHIEADLAERRGGLEAAARISAEIIGEAAAASLAAS